MAMLKCFGVFVKSNKNGSVTVMNKITHPCNVNRFLYFFCDVPHIEKNLAGGWRKCRQIKMSDDLCEKYDFAAGSVIDINQVFF